MSIMTFKQFSLGLFCGIVIVGRAMAATDYFVWRDNPDPHSPYASWATAATNIQDAIDASSAGDTVWVTNGVYAVGGQINYPVGTTLTNRVVINKAITVRSANNDPANTIIQGAWDPATNGPAAVRCVYMSAGSLIGFTITNGATFFSAAAPYNNNYDGGGVFCEENSPLPMISNCVITGNAARNQGGGVRRGRLVDCKVQGNLLASYGAGAYSSMISNCMLIGNSSVNNGGGVYEGTLYNCSLISNTATYGGGGAMNATLYNCILTANKAPGGAGGGASGGSLSNCTMTGNSANGHGGGAANASLYYCTLIGNKATSSGGGGAKGGTLYNCNVISNDGAYAGGVFNSTCYNSLLIGNKGGVYNAGGSLDSILYNCTIVGNSTLGEGGGVRGGIAINCIIYDNSATVKGANWITNSLGSVIFTNCCTTPEQAGWAVGNITNNPALVDRAAGNYRLRGASPCVNAGMAFSWMTVPANVHSKDLDGKPRIFGVAVDMGVYEYVAKGTLITVR